jgi:hypothetical protein
VKGDRHFEIAWIFVTVRIYNASPYVPTFNELFLIPFLITIPLQTKEPYASSIVTEISMKLRRQVL